MPSAPRANTRSAGPSPAGNRQLTLGECIAIGRYGQHYVDASGLTPPLETLLLFIDTIQVCTTCGWSREIHKTDYASRTEIGVCGEYTRKL
jgi:hypothetical protein